MTDPEEHAAAIYELTLELMGQHLTPQMRAACTYALKALERLPMLEASLSKINAIRNDIVKTQRLGWSRHAYPLVEALDEAGFALEAQKGTEPPHD